MDENRRSSDSSLSFPSVLWFSNSFNSRSISVSDNGSIRKLFEEMRTLKEGRGCEMVLKEFKQHPALISESDVVFLRNDYIALSSKQCSVHEVNRHLIIVEQCQFAGL